MTLRRIGNPLGGSAYVRLQPESVPKSNEGVRGVCWMRDLVRGQWSLRLFVTHVEKTEVVKMHQESVCANGKMFGPVLVVPQRPNKYGSVPGLDDQELADPAELERAVLLQEWGPVLALPVQGRRDGLYPDVDESGGVDWGAFGTVDFSRTVPEFDKARYKADKLKEELKYLTMRISSFRQRLPGQARCLVLKYLRMGIISMDDIVDADMLILARLCSRAWSLGEEIGQLRKASEARGRKRLEWFWG